jgi:Zn-dependent M28 family amino/carboxypeptidase
MLPRSSVLLSLFLFACQPAGEQDPIDVANKIQTAWVLETLTALSADGMEGRDNLSAGGQRAREYLIGQMEALGLEAAGSQGYEQAFAEGVNLVGRIDGSDPVLADQAILLSAHYDHLGLAGQPGSQCQPLGQDMICNGAADNATGVAVVLAVARALIESDLSHRRPVWLVLFDAEEDGLLGSRAFVEAESALPMSSVVSVLNVDTVGTQIFPGVEQSLALNSEYNPTLRDAVLMHNEAVALTTLPVSSFFDGSEQGERSDHYPFHHAGVPALFFSSGAPAEYHTPADEVGLVDLDKLLGSTRHLFLLTHQLADGETEVLLSDAPTETVDDAVALLALGHQLLADPQAAGLDDPLMIEVLAGWMDQLQGYVDHPPTTSQGWQDYRDFVRSIIDAVFLAIGR